MCDRVYNSYFIKHVLSLSLYVIFVIGPKNMIKGLYRKKLVWQMAKERVFSARWHTVT